MHDLSLLTDLVVIFAAAVLVVLLLSRIGLPSIAGLIDASALERAVEAARRTFPALVITVRSRYQGEVAHLRALGATHVVAAEVEAGRTITEQVLRRSIPAGEIR